MSRHRKKLIEVALPLEALNQACKEDKDRKTGHIRNIHKWFAPMPLPAWRAVIFASLVDDPGNDLPHEEAARHRQELLRILEGILPLSATHDSKALASAREILAKSADNLPTVVDPFCGGGSTLVEAQRLGFRVLGCDLNPIPVLISRTLCLTPSAVLGKHPVSERNDELFQETGGYEGFKKDVRYFAAKIRDRAWSRLGHLYPASPTGETVITWRWARTVPSPDPAQASGRTPLVRDWWLSKRKGNSAWIEPTVDRSSNSVTYTVKRKGSPQGSTLQAGSTKCLFSGAPIAASYIREQGKKGLIRDELIALVARDTDTRVTSFHSPTEDHLEIALSATPEWEPEIELPEEALGFRVQGYGLRSFAELFSSRQLASLSVFSSLVAEIRDDVLASALEDGMAPDTTPLRDEGKGAHAYADAIVSVLGLSVGKLAQISNKLVRWYIDSRNGSGLALPAFDRQTVSMSWDYAETNPFGGSSGDWEKCVETALRAFDLLPTQLAPARIELCDARQASELVEGKALVATDPPYYDNIGYADLSDFFYSWLRRSLGGVHPDLFKTVASPKQGELIAAPHRHDGDRAAADDYFRGGFVDVFSGLASVQTPGVPITVVYAYKQQEQQAGRATGWEVMLRGIIEAGLSIVGTWPISAVRSTRMRGVRSNALTTAILVVCLPGGRDRQDGTRSEFRRSLRKELPVALDAMTLSNIAPVDLAQAAIGPGMAVFCRYSRIVEANGQPMTVRAALELIGEALDEVLTEGEAKLDSDSRFAATWFEAHGFNEGPFGEADTLAKARNVSVAGVRDAGVLKSTAGKVRLYTRAELPKDWDPEADNRLTVWEATQHLIKRLEEEGEQAAASLLSKLGSTAEQARNLAYSLYTTCERRGWADEAQAYDGLVRAWPELEKLTAEGDATSGSETQAGLFE